MPGQRGTLLLRLALAAFVRPLSLVAAAPEAIAAALGRICAVNPFGPSAKSMLSLVFPS